eukprot:GHVN01028497.1.p1 GENE.GHVN01028497.1~~GHVN01028497.1.p1  ORF type:complete len:1591 (-),score=466.91 GHVN01028497.1:178-4950(-)
MRSQNFALRLSSGQHRSSPDHLTQSYPQRPYYDSYSRGRQRWEWTSPHITQSRPLTHPLSYLALSSPAQAATYPQSTLAPPNSPPSPQSTHAQHSPFFPTSLGSFSWSNSPHSFHARCLLNDLRQSPFNDVVIQSTGPFIGSPSPLPQVAYRYFSSDPRSTQSQSHQSTWSSQQQTGEVRAKADAVVGRGEHARGVSAGEHVSEVRGGEHVSEVRGGEHVSEVSAGEHVSEVRGGEHVSEVSAGEHVSEVRGGEEISEGDLLDSFGTTSVSSVPSVSEIKYATELSDMSEKPVSRDENERVMSGVGIIDTVVSEVTQVHEATQVDDGENVNGVIFEETIPQTGSSHSPQSNHSHHSPHSLLFTDVQDEWDAVPVLSPVTAHVGDLSKVSSPQHSLRHQTANYAQLVKAAGTDTVEHEMSRVMGVSQNEAEMVVSELDAYMTTDPLMLLSIELSPEVSEVLWGPTRYVDTVRQLTRDRQGTKQVEEQVCPVSEVNQVSQVGEMGEVSKEAMSGMVSPSTSTCSTEDQDPSPLTLKQIRKYITTQAPPSINHLLPPLNSCAPSPIVFKRKAIAGKHVLGTWLTDRLPELQRNTRPLSFRQQMGDMVNGAAEVRGVSENGEMVNTSPIEIPSTNITELQKSMYRYNGLFYRHISGVQEVAAVWGVLTSLLEYNKVGVDTSRPSLSLRIGDGLKTINIDANHSPHFDALGASQCQAPNSPPDLTPSPLSAHSPNSNPSSVFGSTHSSISSESLHYDPSTDPLTLHVSSLFSQLRVALLARGVIEYHLGTHVDLDFTKKAPQGGPDGFGSEHSQLGRAIMDNLRNQLLEVMTPNNILNTGTNPRGEPFRMAHARSSGGGNSNQLNRKEHASRGLTAWWSATLSPHSHGLSSQLLSDETSPLHFVVQCHRLHHLTRECINFTACLNGLLTRGNYDWDVSDSSLIFSLIDSLLQSVVMLGRSAITHLKAMAQTPSLSHLIVPPPSNPHRQRVTASSHHPSHRRMTVTSDGFLEEATLVNPPESHISPLIHDIPVLNRQKHLPHSRSHRVNRELSHSLEILDCLNFPNAPLCSLSGVSDALISMFTALSLVSVRQRLGSKGLPRSVSDKRPADWAGKREEDRMMNEGMPKVISVLLEVLGYEHIRFKPTNNQLTYLLYAASTRRSTNEPLYEDYDLWFWWLTNRVDSFDSLDCSRSLTALSQLMWYDREFTSRLLQRAASFTGVSLTESAHYSIMIGHAARLDLGNMKCNRPHLRWLCELVHCSLTGISPRPSHSPSLSTLGGDSSGSSEVSVVSKEEERGRARRVGMSQEDELVMLWSMSLVPKALPILALPEALALIHPMRTTLSDRLSPLETNAMKFMYKGIGEYAYSCLPPISSLPPSNHLPLRESLHFVHAMGEQEMKQVERSKQWKNRTEAPSRFHKDIADHLTSILGETLQISHEVRVGSYTTDMLLKYQPESTQLAIQQDLTQSPSRTPRHLPHMSVVKRWPPPSSPLPQTDCDDFQAWRHHVPAIKKENISDDFESNDSQLPAPKEDEEKPLPRTRWSQDETLGLASPPPPQPRVDPYNRSVIPATTKIQEHVFGQKKKGKLKKKSKKG